MSVFSVSQSSLCGRIEGEATRKTEHDLHAQPQGQGFSFWGSRNDYLWQENILHSKEIETSSWQKISIDNFLLARTYLWWYGVAKVKPALFSETSTPDFGVAKGFTSSFGEWNRCGNGNIAPHLSCLSPRSFGGSAEGGATWPIQVLPSSYDRWMYAAVKLNLTNMHNRFCLWGAARAKRWLGLNAPAVTSLSGGVFRCPTPPQR